MWHAGAVDGIVHLSAVLLEALSVGRPGGVAGRRASYSGRARRSPATRRQRPPLTRQAGPEPANTGNPLGAVGDGRLGIRPAHAAEGVDR